MFGEKGSSHLDSNRGNFLKWEQWAHPTYVIKMSVSNWDVRMKIWEALPPNDSENCLESHYEIHPRKSAVLGRLHVIQKLPFFWKLLLNWHNHRRTKGWYLTVGWRAQLHRLQCSSVFPFLNFISSSIEV